MARTPKVVEDRREQILEAALRVFAAQGFARATNRAIAREAGITTGLIYHYFASKEALFRAIIEERSPLRLVRGLPPEALDQPPEIFLPFLARQVFAAAEAAPFVQLIHLFLPEVIQNPALAALGLPGLGELAHVVERYLAEQLARGTLRQHDPALTAQVLIGGLMGLVFRRQVLRDAAVLRYSREELADGVVLTALHGLLPEH